MSDILHDFGQNVNIPIGIYLILSHEAAILKKASNTYDARKPWHSHRKRFYIGFCIFVVLTFVGILA